MGLIVKRWNIGYLQCYKNIVSTFCSEAKDVRKNSAKPSLVNLSVEEENLAAIPFAVLERRVGKRIGKIEIKGNKILPNGERDGSGLADSG
jgi:hypothetical protein